MLYRKIHRILNAIIAICLLGFVVIFLKGPSSDWKSESPTDEPKKSATAGSTTLWRERKTKNGSRVESSYPIYDNSDGGLTAWNFKGYSDSVISGKDVVKSVTFLNDNFNILNIDKFGPVENVRYLLVIQVHNRPIYLKYLIESLRQTKDIEKTLLVFSHDVNVEQINEMVRNITFARVYQIFYPFNLQLFAKVFPGNNPLDCPEKIGKDSAKTSKCRNWEWPDKYGNYRNGKLTQIKHHWWWKMNYVFDGIVKRFNLKNSWVLLLEEDHFVTPDALHVLDIIVGNKKKYCDRCEIISLGFYLKSTNKFGNDIAKLGVHPWYSSKHNMGMALQQETWLKIKNCSNMFCDWDDYNWDWSLMQVSAKCLPQRFRVIFAKSPRVIHIGDCGVHTHRCDAHNAYEATTKLLESHRGALFPASLAVTDISRRSLKPSKENGGWGDIRDRELCLLNTSPLLDKSNAPVLAELFNSTIKL
ncbi:unnamed protein product [Caenorhabditis auriculariae]|uniref:Alpha-1,6-mannosyl-glycoprotein 2-beta-N-acetylglucosaminyltransferase n=1 Tax=Caenorhabditis auriculariae TaxID=2777116 RepID=A0A8S1HBJ0_9PELO|nr:unnamed protein product [Caenorhabditis auriculariae]